MEKYFKIYSNCILVKGLQRSVICDLQKQTFHIIPNTLYNILSKKRYNTKSIKQLYNKFNKNRSVLEEYFTFLINENLIILSESKKILKNFPKLSQNFLISSKITNAIIDFNEINYNYQKVIMQLDELQCKDIMVRYFSENNISSLNRLVGLINKSNILNMELVLPYCSTVNENNFHELVKKSNKISKVYVHSTLEHLKENFVTIDNTKIIFTKQKINSSECCGYISSEYFQTNIEMYLQSLNYNNCLYKKIGIDENGEIKNCPAMNQSFGNVNNTDLSEVIQKKKYKELWFLKKDKIEVCKDCEFRYICSDCRFHVENTNNLKSKPSKCNYDPSIAEWKD